MARDDDYNLFGTIRRVVNKGRPTRGDDDRPVFTPGGGEDGEDGGFIGVPDNYSVPRVRTGTYSARGAESAANWGGEDRTPGTIGARTPMYSEGDEWRPAGLGPAGIGELQAMMAASGLLGDDWRYGIWDEPSREAYKSLLAEANGMGLTAEQALKMRAESGTFPGSGGSGSEGGGGGGHWEVDGDGNPVWVPDQYVAPPLELRTPNRKDVIRAFRAGIIDTMGEGWSQEQIEGLADAYISRHVDVQAQAYTDRVEMERAAFEGTAPPGGGGIIRDPEGVDVESPETFLENQLMEKDPAGFQAGQIVEDFLPEFVNALGGWV